MLCYTTRQTQKTHFFQKFKGSLFNSRSLEVSHFLSVLSLTFQKKNSMSFTLIKYLQNYNVLNVKTAEKLNGA